MNPFLILALAIACEVAATTALKLSEGFTRPLPSVVVVVGYAGAFYLFSIALRNMQLGTAYAIWSGLGTAAAVVIGMFIWREQLDIWRVLGLSLIVAGVVVLNLFAEGAAA